MITLDNPPVNGLGHAVRSAIVAGVDRANADAAVAAIVITGAGKTFSAGADIREFNTPKATAEPTLRTVIRVVEASAKPVVAAIGGACMGGGLELALGCHYRVAAATAPIALPEVKLGLMPGAGGTQRLPRAIGVETALNMIVTGASVPAAQLEGTALFDAIVDGDALDAALRLRERSSREKLPCKRVRDIDGATIRTPKPIFQFARNTRRDRRQESSRRRALCVDAVAAAVTMPFEEGLRFERELFHAAAADARNRARCGTRSSRSARRHASTDVPEGTPARRIERVAHRRRRNDGHRHRA